MLDPGCVIVVSHRAVWVTTTWMGLYPKWHSCHKVQLWGALWRWCQPIGKTIDGMEEGMGVLFWVGYLHEKGVERPVVLCGHCGKCVLGVECCDHACGRCDTDIQKAVCFFLSLSRVPCLGVWEGGVSPGGNCCRAPTRVMSLFLLYLSHWLGYALSMLFLVLGSGGNGFELEPNCEANNLGDC